MTNKQAEKLLPIITAFAQGKKIEVRHKSSNWPEFCEWQECCDPSFASFDLNKTQYRIKPDLLEFWRILTPSGMSNCFKERVLAEKYLINPHNGLVVEDCKIIHFREVPPS